ncbi:CTDSPL isoform 8 [Pongo abelii]|uniref:CTDSPL isoform 8 n=1 Tax=Pongo abelii TaxID=9601 RepID=A0A2J8WYE9_PONAB|nr:CTDSPL isoform 8 [Pongo abelii]
MDGPAIITQVTNPKEDEGRLPGAGEKDSLSEKGKKTSGRRIRKLSTHLSGRCNPR